MKYQRVIGCLDCKNIRVVDFEEMSIGLPNFFPAADCPNCGSKNEVPVPIPGKFGRILDS